MTGAVAPELKGASRTLLLTLCARCQESTRPDAIIRDDEAIRIATDLGLAFTEAAHVRWQTQIAIAVRSHLIDHEAQGFVTRKRDPAIVNLGAGLCTRLSRIGAPDLACFDVDLPPTADVWQRAFGGSNRRFVGGSVVHHEWMDAIDHPADQLLFVAEGLFMYLPPATILPLLAALAERFPGAELLVETVGPLEARASRLHADVACVGAIFLSGLKSARDLQRASPAVHFVNEWFFVDYHPERWGWMRLLGLLPVLKREMKIGHLRLAGGAQSG